MNNDSIYLSIVIPVYNEEDNIGPLFEELSTVLNRLNKKTEIIFVDDGSTDKSFIRLKEIWEKHPDLVKVIRFRRNFGQTAAMAAGFNYAHGEIIITMDADLQNDPNDIPKLIEKIEEGYDLVSGWRIDRKDKFLTRRFPSMIANWIISRTTNVKLHDYGCTLKAFKSDIAKNLNLYGEMHRFIPALAHWIGVEVAEIPVNHRPRKMGKSKYGLSRTLRVILDLITVKFLLTYSTRPIHIFGTLGIFSGLTGFFLALYLSWLRLFKATPLSNRPLLLLAILLIFLGVQFISIGLLGELQIRTYHESQGKPIYSVREILEEKE